MEEQPTQPDTQGLGKVMAICAWILAILMMTLFFSHWSNKQEKPVAKMVTVNGIPELTIKRNINNQYIVDGFINGADVTFLLDTGANTVVIPEKIAKKLKLNYGPEGMANTAGGVIKIYHTRIEQLVIGNITLHNVAANINPKDEDEEILLGMSALKRLSISQEGDNLVLTVKNSKETDN